MKKIDDSKIYGIFALVTLSLAIVVGAISAYSLVAVEPEVKALLAAEEPVSESYKKAYLILRDPQVFGLYEHFDSEGRTIKNSLRYFDGKVDRNEEFKAEEKKYLELLLNRRHGGARLGINSMVFLLILTLIGGGMYLVEKRQLRD